MQNKPTTLPFFAVLILASLAVVVLTQAGCAAPVDAQWSDPQLSSAALRGKRVMVACEADEAVVKRLCADKLAAAVNARGATAVMAPEALINAPSGPAPTDDAYLAAAREQGAGAVLTSRIAPVAVSEGAGSGFRIGLGGFGFGGGGIHTGVGLSAPIGGTQVSTSYAANSRVLDPSGKLLWTAKASASSRASDLQGQVDELNRALFEALDKAGVF